MLRIIKKSIAWSLAVVMLFTVSPVFADNEAKSGKSEINDISRSWAKSMIEKLSENEIITGYPDGTFRPDKEVSREEACVMIAKYISGNNVGNSSSEFKDTKGRWSDPYIAFMLKEKLVSGYPDGMFKPAKPISREEFSFILYNYLKKVVDMGKVETVQFKDSVSSWAKDAVGKLAGLKIISGYQDGLFRGANNIVRAEIAKLITETDKKQETIRNNIMTRYRWFLFFSTRKSAAYLLLRCQQSTPPKTLFGVFAADFAFHGDIPRIRPPVPQCLSWRKSHRKYGRNE